MSFSLIITGGGEGDVRILESFDGDDVTAQTGTGSVYAVACKVMWEYFHSAEFHVVTRLFGVVEGPCCIGRRRL